MSRHHSAIIAVALGLSASAAQATVINLFSPWVPNGSGVWSKVAAPGVLATITMTTAPTTGSVDLNNTLPMVLTVNPSDNAFALYTLALWDEANPTLPKAVNQLTITAYDIDSDAGAPGNLSDVWGYETATTAFTGKTVGSDLELGTAQNANYTVYQMKSSLWGLPGSNITATDILSSPGNVEQVPVSVSLHFNSFTSGNFYWGVTGALASPMIRGQLLAGQSIDVPEPGSAAASALAGAGLFGLVTRRRRRA